MLQLIDLMLQSQVQVQDAFRNMSSQQIDGRWQVCSPCPKHARCCPVAALGKVLHAFLACDVLLVTPAEAESACSSPCGDTGLGQDHGEYHWGTSARKLHAAMQVTGSSLQQCAVMPRHQHLGTGRPSC